MNLAKRLRAAATAFSNPEVLDSPAPAASESEKGKIPPIDPMMCGLGDAVRSGWYNQDSNELAPGFAITKVDTVIDIGCGGGNAAHFYLPRCKEALLLDMVFENVRAAATQNYSEQAIKPLGLCGSVNKLPVRDGYAKKIIVMEVLEHTTEPLTALKEIHRIGSADAQYLITVPSAISEKSQRDWAPEAYFQFPNHIQQFDIDGLTGLLHEAGFAVERQLNWGFYWSIALLLHWISQRENGIHLEGAALDSIKPPYNDLMMDWAQFWQKIIRDPERRPLAQTLNQIFPRNIGVVARKTT